MPNLCAIPAPILSAGDKRGLKVSLPIIRRPLIRIRGKESSPFFKESEREKKEEGAFFIYRLPVYRSCRHETLKILRFLSAQADLFQELDHPSSSSSTVWATSVGTLPPELNSRVLPRLWEIKCVHGRKTCETENVAPRPAPRPCFNGSFDLSLFFVGLQPRNELPWRKRGRNIYASRSFNKRGNTRVNLLADFGRFYWKFHGRI